MANVINRSTIPSLLFPGLKQLWGDTYDHYDPLWSQFFTEQSSKLATERTAQINGFGQASRKPEGSPIKYQSMSQGYLTEVAHTVWATGFMITREAMDDDQYEEVAAQRTTALARAMNTTVETEHHNLLINGFSNYMTGDGVSLFNNAHPTADGVASNIGSTNADLSEASLEDLITEIYAARDGAGNTIRLIPKVLVISTAQVFNADRILESELRVNTNNNDVNAMKNMGLFPGGAIASPYLSALPNAYYIVTDIPAGTGLVSYWRDKPELSHDNEFDTQNAKYSVWARFAPAVLDFHAVYANVGV